MTKALPEGIYIQPYMDKFPGATRQDKISNLRRQVQLWKELGAVGVAWHGFAGPEYGPWQKLDPVLFEMLSQLAQEQGLKSLAAYGLGSTKAVAKGEFIGKVGALDSCDGILFDMEGAWENDASDKPDAKKMGDAYRALAPNQWTADQPWFAPASHWSKFPWEETAGFVNERCPQVYCNDFVKQWGPDAYEKVWAWYQKDWQKLDARLAPKNLVRPRRPTIQGYAWNNLADLVNCLTSNPSLFVWCEPFPDAQFIQGLRIQKRLTNLGFRGPDAVRKFQENWNATGGRPLTVDNQCGPNTISALNL